MGGKLNILNFLEEYEKFPCLWLKSSPEYKLREKRDSAEKTLLAISGLPSVKELRRQIRSIRCTYNQEVVKIKASMVAGSGSNRVYRPKLAWFEFADNFLKKNRDQGNETETNYANDLLQMVYEEQDLEQQSSSTVPIPTTSSMIMPSPSKITKRVSKKCGGFINKKSKVDKSFDKSLDNAVEALKYACSQKTTTDEFSIFGQYVATQLEKLPLETALSAQQEILMMLTNTRLAIISDQKSYNNYEVTSPGIDQKQNDEITVANGSKIMNTVLSTLNKQ